MGWILTLLETLAATAAPLPQTARYRRERGSVTIEHVLWAVAVIAIVAVVVAAVRAYVITQAGNIQ